MSLLSRAMDAMKEITGAKIDSAAWDIELQKMEVYGNIVVFNLIF